MVSVTIIVYEIAEVYYSHIVLNFFKLTTSNQNKIKVNCRIPNTLTPVFLPINARPLAVDYKTASIMALGLLFHWRICWAFGLEMLRRQIRCKYRGLLGE